GMGSSAAAGTLPRRGDGSVTARSPGGNGGGAGRELVQQVRRADGACEPDRDAGQHVAHVMHAQRDPGVADDAGQGKDEGCEQRMRDRHHGSDGGGCRGVTGGEGMLVRQVDQRQRHAARIARAGALDGTLEELHDGVRPGGRQQGGGAAAASRNRRRESPTSSRIASTKPRGSSGETSSPVSFGTTLSRNPPASAAMTGTPEDMASSATSPHVSVEDVNTQRSALAYRVAKCWIGRNPRSRTNGSRLAMRRAMGPSPATTNVARCPRAWCATRHASIRA